jgi:hypothetical protein
LSIKIVADHVQLSKSFGNEKPDILLQIELSLWRVLLRVATGEETIHTALFKFFEDIPTDELAALPEEVRGFYASCMLF